MRLKSGRIKILNTKYFQGTLCLKLYNLHWLRGIGLETARKVLGLLTLRCFKIGYGTPGDKTRLSEQSRT
jgi:hypothetical protein